MNDQCPEKLPSEKILNHRSRLKTVAILFSIAPPLLYILVSVFVFPRPCCPCGGEATAIASLKAIANAQTVFIKSDYYKKGTKIYANPNDGGGISDLYEVGYDGTNATDKAHKLLDRTVARADDSLSNPIPKGGYLVRDLKCDDYTKQFAALAYPSFYLAKERYILGIKIEQEHTGRNIFVINKSGIVYMIDAKVLYPDIKPGDAISMTMERYPTDLSKWTEAGK